MITNDSKNKKTGLYIHIPFCEKRCNYCDFLSYSSGNWEDHKAYVDALVTELDYHSHKAYIFDTIYIGGGSPSFLSIELIDCILGAIHKRLKLTANPEITIEVNPGQISKDKLRAYVGGGINRLSMGAQSFDQGLLKIMGRIHKKSDIVEGFYLARENGFSNISLDLIFALPGQSLNLWVESLNQALDLCPEHISFYALQIEQGTPFYTSINNGSLKAVSDSEDRDMYHRAVDILKERGYIHYEISNGAKLGFESRHNMKYWSMEDYLGLGLGSHSYIEGERSSNEDNLSTYIKLSREIGDKPGQTWPSFQSALNWPSSQSALTLPSFQSVLARPSLRSALTLPSSQSVLARPSPWSIFSHKNTREDEMAEYMFTGLRKVEGINILDYTMRFGRSPLEIYKKPIEGWSKEGFLVVDERKNSLKMTLKGMDLFNRVLVDFI